MNSSRLSFALLASCGLLACASDETAEAPSVTVSRGGSGGKAAGSGQGGTAQGGASGKAGAGGASVFPGGGSGGLAGQGGSGGLAGQGGAGGLAGQGGAGAAQGGAGQAQGGAGTAQGGAGQAQGGAGAAQGGAGAAQGGAGAAQGGAGSGQAGSGEPVDHCSKATLGDGAYCGGSLSPDADQGTLLHCEGGKTVGATPCAGGCHVAPPGEADYCEGAAPADPCSTASSGDGPYCGGSLTPPGDQATLYICKGKKTASSSHCDAGCHVSPPGKADYCETATGSDPCSGATLGDGLYCGSSLPGGDGGTLYSCQGKKSQSSSPCPAGCHVAPPGQSDYCESLTGAGGGGQGPGGGFVSCGAAQWWDSNITYGPYKDYNPGQGVTYWWDTDLHMNASSEVQLRHDSKLIAEGVHAWGWQPTFIDQATGKTFQFLHLRPQNKYTTEIGKVYPAGTIVGLSGGDTADTGYPKYSTAAHLCVQTPDEWGASFPPGDEPCK